ncbi:MULTISPECIES: YtxH domain-containing protein [unclassified Rathayibacter]|uniref:YtxH domain-containing protein n=1 Tax=unclassified Rathayibacter TaxID=2609250 RepID=UPI0021570698|nr:MULTISPECIES: YtxH domain-containing protein [unclassified Rathayibacter]
MAGAAAGYVLGARAGRKRYEQIASAADRFWRTQPVQDVAGAVGGAAKAQLSSVSDKAYEVVRSVVVKAVSGGRKAQGASEAEASAAARKAASKVDEAAASAGSGGSTTSTSTSRA